MSTYSKLVIGLTLLLAALMVFPAIAQDSIKIEFPPESPLAVVSADWGSSRTTPRGGALLVDLHTSLRLKNASQRRIRGVTLLVLSQEVTPGGKASVSVPSLDVGPGEVFPVRVDLRLLRPIQAPAGPLVRVNLDGVLFDDLSFFGPNQLNSRRSMVVWELQARRERAYFKKVLEARGQQGLQQEALQSLARQADRPRLDVRMARRGRATNLDAAKRYQFAFLRMPDAPVEPLSGSAHFAGREAMSPRLRLRNHSGRPVRHVSVGWVLTDDSGKRYLAGSVPADVTIAPGATGEATSETALRLGQTIAVKGMEGFVREVEFDNGEVWIPAREDLAALGLESLIGPSPEEQRLTNIYRKKGIKALVAELGKF
jgi:hypothetical protein